MADTKAKPGEALKRDWEQTKHDFNKDKGQELGQNVGDTVGQAVGKRPLTGSNVPQPRVEREAERSELGRDLDDTFDDKIE